MLNELQHETSPYLLQHAKNPVHWQPWNATTLANAQQKNQLLVVSIGYSACHWCHVMEHESFENQEVAKVMNSNYTSIKIDREERPDIDALYMKAVQIMTNQGGWPLNVVCLPDGRPVWGGTYFRKDDWIQSLEQLAAMYKSDTDQIVEYAKQLHDGIKTISLINKSENQSDIAFDKNVLENLVARWRKSFDMEHGGMSRTPKFMMPNNYAFLMRYAHQNNDQELQDFVDLTLTKMAYGGLFDTVGGGFSRYSVDEKWHVPHFEKMLYDQAQLINSYLDAYQITKDEFFATVARETVDYVLRDMTSKEGGFFSAEDADSVDLEKEGHTIEGAFYVWKKSEIENVLNTDELKIFCYHYAVEENGNVLSDPHQEFVGKNILCNPYTIEQTAKHFSLKVDEVRSLISSAKKKLFEYRNKRPRPLCDDKVLTSWNGLMIGALARASRTLHNPSYSLAAVRAAEFIFSTIYNPEQKILYRRYRDGEVKFEAHLEDYSFLAFGLLDLYQSTFDLRWLQWAEELTGKAITLFWDSAEGGFFDTSGKDNSILVRMKEAYDGAEPTGNSISAMNLLKLYELTNEQLLKEYLQKTLKHFCALLVQSPQVMPQLMAALEYFLSPPEHIVIVSDQLENAMYFLSTILKDFAPNLNVVVITDSQRDFFDRKLSFTKEMKMVDGKTTVYFCKNYTCELPTNNVEEFKRNIVGQ